MTHKKYDVFYNQIAFRRNQSSRPCKPRKSPKMGENLELKFSNQDMLGLLIYTLSLYIYIYISKFHFAIYSKCVCVRARSHACVRACVCVHALMKHPVLHTLFFFCFKGAYQLWRQRTLELENFILQGL